jgi:hypothetical protein
MKRKPARKRQKREHAMPLSAVRALFADFRTMIDEAMRAHEDREDKRDREAEERQERRIEKLVSTLTMDRGSLDFALAERRAAHVNLEGQVDALKGRIDELEPEVDRLGERLEKVEEGPFALRPLSAPPAPPPEMEPTP